MWITSPEVKHNDVALYCFKREFTVGGDALLKLKISAESRYKLYLNGKLVSLGPCKSNNNIKYYETVDLSSKLKKGTNVLTADVLQLPDEFKGPMRLAAVVRTGYLAFYAEGLLKDENGETDLSADTENWYVAKYCGIEFPISKFSSYSGLSEIVTDTKLGEYKKCERLFDTGRADGCLNPYGEFSKWILKSRTIPQLFRKKTSFLNGIENVTVEKNGKYEVVLDAGELTTGYINIDTSGGIGTKITVLSSECYEMQDGDRYYKNIRDDKSGVLRGDVDEITVDNNDFLYENFWFRTFRFVKLTIETGDTPITINEIYYYETGYPLNIEGTYSSDGDLHKEMYDISVRTLRRCMHETYEDCPYYEQLQYTMDSRLQMLFSYYISNDHRLIKRCIELFHSSRNDEGMLQSRVPCQFPQVIPQFALHFVFMLSDFVRYAGDLDFAKQYMSTVDGVLNWFESKVTEKRLVGETGYWPYFDWVEGWNDGVPPAEFDGGATVISLVYSYALQEAAYIAKALGYDDSHYIQRSDNLINSVNTYCYDEHKKMYKDGEKYNNYCLHTQLWAVIAGADDGKELMNRAMATEMPKPSYSMAFFLMRALEKSGNYDLSDDVLKDWKDMVNKHCTTWVEDPIGERSECHAWGSMPIYEFMAVRLGVRPLAYGYNIIGIKPYINGLNYASGTVCTVKGNVNVNWKKENNVFSLCVISPKGVKKIISMPNGEDVITYDENIKLNCNID